jgi:hypothetical protein
MSKQMQKSGKPLESEYLEQQLELLVILRSRRVRIERVAVALMLEHLKIYKLVSADLRDMLNEFPCYHAFVLFIMHIWPLI